MSTLQTGFTRRWRRNRVRRYVRGRSASHGIQKVAARPSASSHGTAAASTNCAANRITSAAHTTASSSEGSSQDFHAAGRFIAQSIHRDARRAMKSGGRRRLWWGREADAYCCGGGPSGRPPGPPGPPWPGPPGPPGRGSLSEPSLMAAPTAAPSVSDRLPLLSVSNGTRAS